MEGPLGAVERVAGGVVAAVCLEGQEIRFGAADESDFPNEMGGKCCAPCLLAQTQRHNIHCGGGGGQQFDNAVKKVVFTAEIRGSGVRYGTYIAGRSVCMPGSIFTGLRLRGGTTYTYCCTA